MTSASGRSGRGPATGPVARVRAAVDPFVLALVLTLAAGLLLRPPAAAVAALDVAADVAVAVLFLLYGMRLPTPEVLAGLRDLRLHSAVLASTFVAFPLLGLATSALARPVLGDSLADGLLFLTLLPSTVQSSVALTSVARGDVPAAISAATVSNVLGMALTPALVLLTLGRAGSVGPAGLRAVLLQLLAPFVVGQLLQRWTGHWLRARRPLTTAVDRGTVLLVVLAAVVAAGAAGVWADVSAGQLAGLVAVSLALLAVALAATWWGGAALGLPLPGRITLLMCGSKKSLATGLPMAAVLFPAAVAAPLAVPVIVFHQLQLVVCAVIARRLALRAGDARSGAPRSAA